MFDTDLKRNITKIEFEGAKFLRLGSHVYLPPPEVSEKIIDE